MAKVKNQEAMLSQLLHLVKKEAALAQTDISGEPGKDTNFTSVSEGTENTDQNGVGPEELNGKQGPEQHPAEPDSAIPVNDVKQASQDIAKFANDVLATIREEMSKSAKAQTDISGEPGKDTKITSVSDGTETTNQNGVGPEELNGKQGPEQKPSTDAAAPTKSASDIGAAFFAALTKRAAEVKAEQAQENHYLMCKAAGRADLETLVQHAVQQLELQKQAEERAQAEEAEKQGAALFHEIYKQAAYEKALEAKDAEIRLLSEKVASTAEAQKAQTEIEKIAAAVADVLEKRLKSSQQ